MEDAHSFVVTWNFSGGFTKIGPSYMTLPSEKPMNTMLLQWLLNPRNAP